MNGDVCNYDATIFNADLNMVTGPFEAYLSEKGNSKSEELYKSIHIEQSNKVPVF
jgi:hypothetical protein